MKYILQPQIMGIIQVVGNLRYDFGMNWKVSKTLGCKFVKNTEKNGDIGILLLLIGILIFYREMYMYL